jgi:hypothetical protein
MSRKASWVVDMVAIVFFLALIGICAKMVWGQQTPVGKIQPYQVRVIGFSSNDCAHCPAQRAQWRNSGVLGAVDEFVLQQVPKSFEVWKVTGTPTTIVLIKNGIDQREFCRFNRVVNANDLQAAVQRAKKAIAAGIPEVGDISEKPAEKLP